MTAKEIREFRTVSSKLIEVEERCKLLEQLNKYKVGLNEEEMFTHSFSSKFKILGNRDGVKAKQREEFIMLTLKYKMRDNGLLMVKLRKQRNGLRRQIENTLGTRSTQCRRLVEDVKNNVNKHRVFLKKKNKKKVEHLVWKYGNMLRENVDMEVTKKMGYPLVFGEDELLKPEDVRKPVVVVRDGESIQLNEDEEQVLMLGPKFCLYVNLSEEELETNVEECIMKIKWDMMGEERKPKLQRRKEKWGRRVTAPQMEKTRLQGVRQHLVEEELSRPP